MKFFLLLFLTSCSSFKFASSDGLPMTWGARAGHDQFVRVEGIVPLYLWGIITPPEAVSINAAFSKEGALSVSKLTIAEDSDWDVWWPRLITFGMYWPVKWRAEGFVQKANLPGIDE